ncbi:MAG: DUF3253 domain-containing protein [Pseudomonadota bacterium]
MDEAVIAAAIRDLAHRRGRDKTFCPSEVARHLSLDWRHLMDDVRRVAATLDDIEATQKGEPVDAEQAAGPIRLGLSPRQPD